MAQTDLHGLLGVGLGAQDDVAVGVYLTPGLQRCRDDVHTVHIQLDLVIVHAELQLVPLAVKQLQHSPKLTPFTSYYHTKVVRYSFLTPLYGQDTE